MSAGLVIDAKALLYLMTQSTKQLDAFYGPVFLKMVAKFATRFEAKMIGDTNPPKIENLDDCNKYIMSNLDKYPDGFCSMAYGVAKAENLLQGSVGAGGKTAVKHGTKDMLAGTSENLAKTGSANATEILKTQLELGRKMRILTGEPKISGDENSAIVVYEGCHLAGACKAIIKEGIGKMGGGFECLPARSCSTACEIAAKIPHDFEVIECNPPKCVFRVFKML